MTDLLGGILLTLVILALAVWIVARINYRIDERHIRCRLGPITIRKIAIEDIYDVERGYRHLSESWTNTIWIPTIRKKGTTLFRRTGGFRRIVLTPDDPTAFIAALKAHERYVPGPP
jgi:hypothetical protein